MEESDAKLYLSKPIIWTEEPLKILGVWIYTDIQKVMKVNFDAIVKKLYNVTKDWQHRSLMVLGRILIADTLLTSKFQYKLWCLLSPPASVIADYKKNTHPIYIGRETLTR